MSELLTIRSTDGLTLEAAVDEPAEPRGVVVVCHPHPQAGGTMNDPLLLALRDALVTDGRAVLRFNFRGVGASEGWPGDGSDEVGDARAAIDSARERLPGHPLAVLGWSFGASVAVRVVPVAGKLSAVIAITPPVTGRAGYSVGLPDTFDPNVSLLVVAGANDTTTDPEAQRAWAAANGARFVALKGANHFFWAKYDDLAAVVTEFLDEAS